MGGHAAARRPRTHRELTDVVFAIDSIPAIFGGNPGAVPGFHRQCLRPPWTGARCASCSPTSWAASSEGRTGGGPDLGGVRCCSSSATWKIPTLISLAVVIVIIASSVIASLLRTRGAPSEASSGARAPQPRQEHPDGQRDPTMRTTTAAARTRRSRRRPRARCPWRRPR